MRAAALRKGNQATPFRPYTLKLSDGGKVPVRHPEFLSLSPTGRTGIVWQPDGSFEVIDLLLVASIVVPDGKSRRRR